MYIYIYIFIRKEYPLDFFLGGTAVGLGYLRDVSSCPLSLHISMVVYNGYSIVGRRVLAL